MISRGPFGMRPRLSEWPTKKCPAGGRWGRRRAGTPRPDAAPLQKAEVLRRAEELRLVRAHRIEHARLLFPVDLGDVAEVVVEGLEAALAQAAREAGHQQGALSVPEVDADLLLDEPA